MQQRLQVLLVLLLLTVGKGFSVAPTDRNVLLRRNSPIVQSFDSLATLSVGNGEFAMSVDPTGLQTFPERYTKDNALITQSKWADRHLGIIGLEFPTTTTIEDFANIEQMLVLNSGIIKTSYTLQGKPISIYTTCHPKRNLVAAHMKSELPIPIKICFPYTKEDASSLLWDANRKHRTKLISKRNNSIVFERTIDAVTYYVVFQWQGDVSVVKKTDNYYVMTPSKGHFAFSCEFLPRFTTTFDDIILPTFKEVAEESATEWSSYWSGDCIQELADSTHLFTPEEERQLLLDCYNSTISGNKKLELSK